TITGFYLIDSLLAGNLVAWRDAAWHILLPAFTLATYPISLTLRMTRAAMVETLSEKYITAARAQGLPEHDVLFRYALKNAIIPTLTVLGLSFAYSLTGAFLIEVIFSWPGLGKYVTDAVLNVDFPVIVSVTLIVTVFYVFINLIVDIIQAVLDPRVALR
ncbi:MAG: ABC transporter permease, partial [Chloroflexi bacterium]|nr:ABC transporter permease [Chloroflexota bacterium]